MNFLKKIFHRSHKTSMDSGSIENNNITATRETSIDEYNPQIDDNSNNVPTESNMANTDEDNNKANKDSSVVSINEFGVTKTLYNLTNVAPVEITETCKELKDIGLSFRSENYSIIIGRTEATPINDIEKNETEINKNITEHKEPNGSHEASTSNIIDDATMQSLKEFEEVLDNIEKTTASNIGTEFIDLDEFIEIFDGLNPENVEPISITNSGKIVSGNDENKDNLNVTENVEIISISSTEEEMSKIEEENTVTAAPDQSDSDDGYNSSDFEFISETEANMTGFIINYGLDNCQNISPASSEPLINYCGLNIDGEAEVEASDPGEGPSGQNRPRNEFEDRSYRNNHNIPEGDDYLGLFQGIYNPLLPMSEIYFLENKSVRASAMNSQYDGIGFDKQLALRRHQPDSSEDEFADEAKESAKKILSMYPGQNRKRRRRQL